MGKIRKHTSKRKSSRLQHNIKKHAAQHTKKIKKEAKKLRAMGLKPKSNTNKYIFNSFIELKKDAGVPNIYPYKEEMMNALERKENLDKAKKQKIKELGEGQSNMANMETYIQEVQAKVNKYEEEKNEFGGLTKEEVEEAKQLMDPNAKQMNQSKKAYMKELKKVLESSDVVIEVLDARDPEGCRSKEIEKQVLSAGKKLLVVINKMDLVPPQNAKAW